MEALFHIDDIPDGHSRSFNYQGKSIIAIRKDKSIYLYLNRCPHLGLPLEWQEHQFLTSDKTLIQCSAHGALFTIEDGQCISGPCAEQALTPLACRTTNAQVFLTEPLND